MCLLTLINRNLYSNFTEKIKTIHNRKLHKLGVSPINLKGNNHYIFNLWDYRLSAREKFLLSLGLNFALPNYIPSYTKFFLAFERLAGLVKSVTPVKPLEPTRKFLQSTAHLIFSKMKLNSKWYPFFYHSDLSLLKRLSCNPDLIITRPDKGRGVVILNRSDYITKMSHILSDSSKFLIEDSSSPYI